MHPNKHWLRSTPTCCGPHQGIRRPMPCHSWQTNTGWALPLHVVDHTRESGDQGHAHSWQTHTGWALPLHVVDHTRESGDQGHAHSWQTNTGWALPLHVVDHTRESGDQGHAHSWQTNTGWALPLHVVDHTRESGVLKLTGKQLQRIDHKITRSLYSKSIDCIIPIVSRNFFPKAVPQKHVHRQKYLQWSCQYIRKARLDEQDKGHKCPKAISRIEINNGI